MSCRAGFLWSVIVGTVGCTFSCTPVFAVSKQNQIDKGRTLFAANCAACHQPTGEGIPRTFPPLAKSDFLNADKIRAIKTVTRGLQGKVTVNGQSYNGVMPAWTLSGDEIADVLTFIYNSWGNSGEIVSKAEVQTHRKTVK